MSVGAGARGACGMARGGVCGVARRLLDASTTRIRWAPRRKLSVRWARDEAPTGPLIGASSAGADGVAVVCARAFALPELKSSCATMLVGIHGHQRARRRRIRLSTRKRSTEGQTEPQSAAAPNLRAVAMWASFSDQQAA